MCAQPFLFEIKMVLSPRALKETTTNNLLVNGNTEGKKEGSKVIIHNDFYKIVYL